MSRLGSARKAAVAGAVACLAVLAVPRVFAGQPLQPEDVLATRYATAAALSPDGRTIAYTVSVPRAIDDDAGVRYTELHVVDTKTGVSRAFISGKINVGEPEWSPDGGRIAFRMRRGKDAKTQVWTIPVDGGEASVATHAKTHVQTFHWHPAGDRIAYVAVEPESKREKALDKKGYGFTYYEEALKPRTLYMEAIDDDSDEADALTDGISVWSFEFSPDGAWIAAGASEANLVDARYMFQSIYLINMATREAAKFSDNPGKLGNFAFSPDGRRIAYTGGLTQNDHAVSQVFVRALSGGETLNLTEPDFRGHVGWCAWKDNRTVLYLADEGVYTTLSTVDAGGGKPRRVVFDGKKAGISIAGLTFTPDSRNFAFTGESPGEPRDVYYWTGKGEPKRLTDLNPWLAERDLGRVEVITYDARDGWPVEGLLYYPVGYQAGTTHPLAVIVHGGPESHYGWGWHSSYSAPVDVMTGEGYVVFLPNYRSSTGYGLAHVAKHLGDAAGVEFDDIADGIKYLEERGIADPARVGLSGGSYGGYAAAWFSTYYTDLVKATVMFVGISDLVSKRSTTDIPYEELYVHSGKKLEDMWQRSLERSPIYYAHQSRTATLIIGGASDTRVHPSQSIELYRRMKMNGHPAVRLVQYPGEGHGNSKMPGRRDVLYRTLQWYDWFVRDGRPIDGGMPDVDISDLYPAALGVGKGDKSEDAIP